MNCKQIREAIDTASRQNLHSGYVSSHLNGCPDCHRYSDEATSLLGLLSAQPRVEAPPDFEFRLRARMARAQAETASDPWSLLRKLMPETFSRGQVVAAAAALALVVTVSIFRVDRENGTSEPISPVTAHRATDQQPREMGPAPEINSPAVESVESTHIKLTNRSVTGRTASSRSAVRANVDSRDDKARIDGSTRFYSNETKRVLNDRSRLYGAETAFYGAGTASISLARPGTTALTF
jgi:hypothetical protein